MKNEIKLEKTIKFNILILVSFVSLICIKFINWFQSPSMDFWVYTDWLIDYSHGFVRRGLSGELIDFLSKLIQPTAFVALIIWLIFIFFSFEYIRLLIKSINKLRPGLFLAALFLPCLLPFYLFDLAAFGRKEILGFLIIFYHIYCLRKFDNAKVKDLDAVAFIKDYLLKLLPITFILLPVTILIHESAILLFVPMHMIITYTTIRLDPSINIRKAVIHLVIMYLPVFFTFSIIFFFGLPKPGVAQEICIKWENLQALPAGLCAISGNDPMWALPGSFAALQWSLSQAVSLTLSFSASTILNWVVIILIMGSSVIYLGIMISSSILNQHPFGETKIFLIPKHSFIMCLKFFILPLIISTPLYFLGWDLGRWFAVICINYLIVCLSREVYFEHIYFTTFAGKEIVFLSKSLTFNKLLPFLEFLSLLLIVFLLRLPHCCITLEKMWFLKP